MVSTTRKLTYEDLALTPEGDGKRYELFGGEIVVAASPAKKHVFLTIRLAQILTTYVQSRLIGMIFPVPADVRLTPYDVVVPDIFYLSNERLHLFGDQTVNGPPDLIVEVLSPSTRFRDLNEKRQLYARTGVAEYWILDIEQSSATVLTLNATGSFDVLAPTDNQIVSRVFPDLRLSLIDLFSGLE